ncbi:hypothetical protein HNY73_007999 [Argiope bruennichi]|uniref:BHLH domain-containing protein n=1 Tax=Argiope bruennichi TaxID=94029 RepID=A0A8T0FBE2_ARGBR|nr:hypothetical protein HNY73_007999 [Argiope bruennichi]
MDSKTYHFDKGDINLTNAKKNEDEVSSFIENHEANDHKELNYENEFLSISRESFREATIQVLDAKSKLHEEIVNSIITPSTISNPIAVQNQTLDYSEPTNKNYETFKVQSFSSTDPKVSMWIDNSGDNTSGNMNDNPALQYHENSQDIYQSPVNLDEISDTQQMQRFITADNQVVYGYKDPNGEFHFFCPTMNERESHNEKERKRRSRVSDACSALRKMIPGMSEKTDKATVFEQAARYLKFLRDKFGTQFDQAYCEKYFQERS